MREKVVLLATAVAAVDARERPQVVAYVDRLRRASPWPARTTRAASLLRGGLLQLSSPELTRLQELHERAIRAAVTRI